jgi:DNA-damage-inducible protein J
MGYNIHEEKINMAKTETIRARVEPTLKKGAEGILKKLGLTSTEAITLFYSQVVLRKGIPFSIELPNEETAETLRKARKGQGVKSYGSIDEFFKTIK